MVRAGPGAGPARPSRAGGTLQAPNISANIKVAVRVRPPNTKEQTGAGRRAVDVVDSRMLVFDPKEDVQPFFYQGVQQQTRNFHKRANKELKFMFDVVFDVEASNEDVFKATTKDILSALMDGFNCSVFVYGATGAGKTFTMIGSKEEPGITYLTMDYLFLTIASYANERDFDICVSYLEVYNENVYDLLKPSKVALQLREDVKFGVMVAGLTLNGIKTARELLDMLEHGNKNRTQHPTDANAESSRSHAVFQVYVKMRYKTTGEVRVVKLSMIDLAGSERASATGCVGERFKEGANINRSLLSLGNCINKLADGCKYIPYRDSKLTRLLKDSLGGNCQTIMIANVSPSSLSYEDTYNTLKYAARANKIQMTIKKNIVDCDMHMSQYVKLVEELRKQVKELKAKLALSSVAPPAVQVKKEIEPVVDKTKMVKWRHRLEEDYKTCGLVESRLLSLMSRQRVLILRQKLKKRALLHVAGLAHDGQDQHMEQVNREDIPRQERTMDSFSRQISSIQIQLHTQWTKWDDTKNKISKLFASALSECPDLVDFVDTLKLNSELRFVKARDSHRLKLMQIQQEEINSSTCYLSDMPKMLKKLYLILKGYGKVTPAMTDEYFDILKKAKNSKAVSWEDEDSSDEVDPQFKFVANLDLEKPSELPFSSMNDIQECMKTEIISDSDNLTDLENEHPVRKRKATPTGKPKADDTIVIHDDSYSDLNCTKIITPSPAKKALKSSFINMSKADIENFSNEINPEYLNSTFVLAGRLDEDKKAFAKTSDVKKGLSDRTNMQRSIISEKGKVSKPPVVGKAIPFRRPGATVTTTLSSVRPTPGARPTVGIRPATAPVTATQRNVQATPNTNRRPLNSAQTSVGYKAVRARERMQTHPYTRPTFGASKR